MVPETGVEPVRACKPEGFQDFPRGLLNSQKKWAIPLPHLDKHCLFIWPHFTSFHLTSPPFVSLFNTCVGGVQNEGRGYPLSRQNPYPTPTPKLRIVQGA